MHRSTEPTRPVGANERKRVKLNLPTIKPLIAAGVVFSTAATDAFYVFFDAAVSVRRGVAAATWGSVWHMPPAVAAIGYTSNGVYVLFAESRFWVSGFLSITALNRVSPLQKE